MLAVIASSDDAGTFVLMSATTHRLVSDSIENLRNLQEDNPAVAGILVELFEVRSNEAGQPWSGVSAGVVHLLAALSGVRVTELQHVIDEVVAGAPLVPVAA